MPKPIKVELVKPGGKTEVLPGGQLLELEPGPEFSRRFTNRTPTQQNAERLKQRQLFAQDADGTGPETLQDDLNQDFRAREEDERLEDLGLIRLPSGRIMDPLKPSASDLDEISKIQTDRRAEIRAENPTISENLEQVFIGGVTDAAINSLNLINEQGQDLRDLQVGDQTVQEILDDFGVGGKIPIEIERLERDGQTGTQMLRGLVSFATAFAVTKKIPGTGPISAGAGADLLAVDRDQNLSNLFNNVAPELRNPITDFLEAKTNDSELEKAVKNVIEGGAVGKALEGTVKSVKFVVDFAKRLKREGFKPPRALQGEEGSIQLGPEGKSRKLSQKEIKQKRDFVKKRAEEMGLEVKDLTGPEKQGLEAEFELQLRGGKPPPAKVFASPGEPIPPEVRQYVNIKGRVKDVGEFSFNFGRSGLPDDVKKVQAGFRQLTDVAEEIEKQAGPVRKLEEVEADALARIKADAQKELNEFLTRDLRSGYTDVDMTIARQIQDESAAQLFMAKEAVLNGVQGSGRVLREQYALHTQIVAKNQVMSAEASRLLGSRRIIVGKEGHRIFSNKVDELVEDFPPNLSDHQLAIRLDAIETPEQLEQMAQLAARPGLFKMFLEAWVGGLLTSLKTQIVNIAGNTSTLLNHFMVERPTATMIGKLRGGTDSPKLLEMKEQAFAVSEALRESLILSWRTLKTGNPQSEVTKLESFHEPNITAENVDALLKRNQKGFRGLILPSKLEKSGIMGRTVDAVGTTARLSFRTLMSADDFFKNMAYRLEISALAYRRAVNEGHVGRKLAEKIAEYKQNPPKDIRLNAEEVSRYLTFTKELTGFGRDFQEFVNKVPLMKLLGATFIRTPGNLMKFPLERFPIAKRLLREVRADIKAGGHRKDMQLARSLNGAAVMTVATMMSANGMITGSFVADKRSRRSSLIRAGHRETSLVLTDEDGGKHFYNYGRNDPFSSFFGIIATYRDILANTQDQEVIDEAGLAAQIAINKQMLNKSWASGIRRTMNAILMPERNDAAYWDNLVKTVIPRIVNDLSREVDPVMRETQGGLEAICSQIPGCSHSLEPRLDRWADPIEFDEAWGPDILSPIRYSKETSDPVDLEIGLNLMDIPHVPKFYRMGGVSIKMTVPQRNRWIMLAGKEVKDAKGRNMKQAVAALMKEERYQQLSEGPEGGREAAVRKIINAYQTAGKNLLLDEFPELANTVEQGIIERQKRLKSKPSDGNFSLGFEDDNRGRSFGGFNP